MLLLLGVAAAGAGVYLSKEEALALAFPAGVAVASETVILTDAQTAKLADRGVSLDSKLFSYHVGRRDGRVVGYAVIDSHVVRTVPEAFMVVLDPDGAIDKVVMLAFYEPPEYKPPDSFLAQFHGKRATSEDWRLGHDVHGISGATLTAHAMRDALRKIVVLYDVVIKPAAGH